MGKRMIALEDAIFAGLGLFFGGILFLVCWGAYIAVIVDTVIKLRR